MNTLYLECSSGISGDMTVAALLDLGVDPQILEQALKSLFVSGFSTKISRVKKSGLDVCDFDVILEQDNHDHDMEYLHSHNQKGVLTPDHNQTYSHNSQPAPYATHPIQHQHSHYEACSPIHDANCHSSQHIHRSLSDILSIIQDANMTESAKQIARNIFTILGEAEAKAHGTSIDQVHFHEVGAADSIVDILSTAICLDELHITNVIIPYLEEGSGSIRCQHGILPVPVPATTYIIQKYQIPLHISEIKGEFVTPTGAAIAAAIRTSGKLPEQFHILRTGLGGGKRMYERPSILRAMLIEPVTKNIKPDSTACIYKLETNIDDCSGEMMGYTMDCLMQSGAKDAYFFPIYMKKNRPAYQLNVLCTEKDISKLEQIIFQQTTTIGIRRQPMERTILPRRMQTIETTYGNVQVKLCSLSEQTRIYLEYDSVIRISRQTGIPYPVIYQKLLDQCRNKIQ